MGLLLNDQVRAIVRAQYKGIYNKYTGGGVGSGRVFYWISMVIWYGGVLFLAGLAAIALPAVKSRANLTPILSGGLLLAMLFWQFIPVMLATTGMSLDLKRLLVYPVAPRLLFAIEVLLRASTGVEVIIIMAGAAIGLIRSPIAPAWGPLFFVPFTLFNLLLSAGVRDLLTRLLTRRGVREVIIFGFVLLTALPQLIISFVPPDKWKHYYELYGGRIPPFPWPWHVTARLAAGDFSLALLGAAFGWLALAAWFGNTQFQRGLSWDADEVKASQRASSSKSAIAGMESFYRLPSRLLRDPLGALVEKEFRMLCRAPRFRLVFFMGFSFGLVIWLPLILGRNRSPGGFSDNILVMVSMYAILLLGEVLFWNILGFDRTAAQAYYVMPVKLSTVLIAKNITAVFFLLLEITIVTAIVLALRLKFPLSKIPEAFAVTLMLSVFLLAIGNLASIHYPRPIDPANSWRHSNNGKIHGVLMLLYPVLALPVGLAYLARYAFSTDLAFYAVIALGFAVGVLTYLVSLESAVAAADERREAILTALSRGEGPIA